MAVVMIGVDPHKGSHTAVALGADEAVLGQVRVRASAAQAERLLTWAKSWPERTWAVEGAGGLGHLLAQELVSAGEQVLDVQPKLAARVRLLASGAVNKNDPNDARSVAADALVGRSRVTVLRGEAGVGKSALLGYLSGRVAGWHAARAAGIESEMELAYAGLHQLCAPMLDHLDRLPAPQRDALATVFGRSAGAAPDRSW